MPPGTEKFPRPLDNVNPTVREGTDLSLVPVRDVYGPDGCHSGSFDFSPPAGSAALAAAAAAHRMLKNRRRAGRAEVRGVMELMNNELARGERET